MCAVVKFLANSEPATEVSSLFLLLWCFKLLQREKLQNEKFWPPARTEQLDATSHRQSNLSPSPSRSRSRSLSQSPEIPLPAIPILKSGEFLVISLLQIIHHKFAYLFTCQKQQQQQQELNTRITKFA